MKPVEDTPDTVCHSQCPKQATTTRTTTEREREDNNLVTSRTDRNGQQQPPGQTGLPKSDHSHCETRSSDKIIDETSGEYNTIILPRGPDPESD